MRFVLKCLIKFISRIIFKIKIVGKENIPKEKSAILCPNHVSHLDALVVIANIKRKVYVFAKDNLFKNKFLKWFFKKLCMYPIKRNSADIQAIKFSLKTLKEDKLLMIFPEGTRKGLEKGVQPKNGAIMMAIKSGAPIIPIGIKGDFKLFTKIEITYGKPIDYSQYKKQTNDKELITKLTTNLMNKVVELTK